MASRSPNYFLERTLFQFSASRACFEAAEEPTAHASDGGAVSPLCWPSGTLALGSEVALLPRLGSWAPSGVWDRGVLPAVWLPGHPKWTASCVPSSWSMDHRDGTWNPETIIRALLSVVVGELEVMRVQSAQGVYAGKGGSLCAWGPSSCSALLCWQKKERVC